MEKAIITQARMGSTRLPGKVLKSISDKPMLEYHLDRIQNTDIPVILATSNNQKDIEIVDLCKKNEVRVIRGDEHDVLSRYAKVVRKYDIETVVRVTSDCPLLDPGLIVEGTRKFEETNVDYLANNFSERSYPHGLDYQITPGDILLEADQKAGKPKEREHVMPYVRNGNNFQKKGLQRENDASWIRITVDYAEDLELIRALIKEHEAHRLNCEEIIELFHQNQELLQINKEHNKKLEDKNYHGNMEVSK